MAEHRKSSYCQAEDRERVALRCQHSSWPRAQPIVRRSADGSAGPCGPPCSTTSVPAACTTPAGPRRRHRTHCGATDRRPANTSTLKRRGQWPTAARPGPGSTPVVLWQQVSLLDKESLRQGRPATVSRNGKARIPSGCGAVAERPIAIDVGEVPLTSTDGDGRACPYLSAGSNPVGTAADPGTCPTPLLQRRCRSTASDWGPRVSFAGQLEPKPGTRPTGTRALRPTILRGKSAYPTSHAGAQSHNPSPPTATPVGRGQPRVCGEQVDGTPVIDIAPGPTPRVRGAARTGCAPRRCRRGQPRMRGAAAQFGLSLVLFRANPACGEQTS